MKVIQPARHIARPRSRLPIGAWAAACLACCLSMVALAETVETAESLPGSGTADENLDYSQKSDYQLTELGARWDSLSRTEREALLREVKLRMAQRNDADGVLVIRTQRRYGRIYHSEGRYLKIETKVVQVRPADGSDKPPQGGFGIGFEQRTAVATEPEAPARVDPSDNGPAEPHRAPVTPPAVRVRDNSG